MTVSIANAGAFLKDKDGNVGKVVGLSANDVTLVNNTISSVAGLDTRVTDAVDSIASVKETADAAKTAADEAKSAADSAKTAADEAKSAADSAKTAADEAKSTADSAKTTANSAFATASQADATATYAQTTAANANSAVQAVDSAWKSAKATVDVTLANQQTRIESVSDTANSAEGIATAMSATMTDVYWPIIQKNQSKLNAVVATKTTESGAETYWPIYATETTYGSTRLMQYDEDSELNNEVVTRALYTALEARVKALESKSSS